MGEARYTEEQVRAAFWRTFHKSGELWFDYLDTEADCEASTSFAWYEFLDNIKPEED